MLYLLSHSRHLDTVQYLQQDTVLLLYYYVTWKHWCHVKPKILWLGGIYVITQTVTVIHIVINEKCNLHTEWIIAHRGAVVTLMTAFHQTIIWKVNNEHSSAASKQYLVVWNPSLTFIFVSLKTQIYSLLQRWLLKCQQTLTSWLVTWEANIAWKQVQ